jgi:hypothetical protein
MTMFAVALGGCSNSTSTAAAPGQQLEGQSRSTASETTNVPERSAASQAYLYVADDNGLIANIEAYAIPVTNGESPSVTLSLSSGIAGAVAAGNGQLFAAQGNDFSDFVLPLRSNERAKATVGLNTVAALAFGSKLVYAANYSGESVSTYALPLTNGETPTVTIGGLDNPLALAVNTKFLFVLERDAVAEYALPLVSGENPTLEIEGFHSPDGLAASTDYLYVASFLDKAVYVYPLHDKSQPTIKLSLPGHGFAVAVDSANLYVSDGNSTLWVYSLPITTFESPNATLLGLPAPLGVAVGP